MPRGRFLTSKPSHESLVWTQKYSRYHHVGVSLSEGMLDALKGSQKENQSP